MVGQVGKTALLVFDNRKRNKEIKEEGDSETVNDVDEKELHDLDWLEHSETTNLELYRSSLCVFRRCFSNSC